MSLSSNTDQYVTLIHDEKQIMQFNEICNNLLIMSVDKENKDFTSCKNPAILLNLGARYKYLAELIPGIGSNAYDQYFLRKLITKDTDLLKTVRQLEVKKECYTYKCKVGDKVEHKPYDSNTLAVYISLNPRDQVKALHKQYSTIMTMLLDGYLDQWTNKKFDNNFYTQLHSTPQCRILIELDIDTKDKKIINRLFEICPETKTNIFFAIETHGGYHFVYYKNKLPKDLHQKLEKETSFNYTEDSRTGIIKSIPKSMLRF